jgi:nickel/cobalt transporter (NicO) family protein
MFSIISGSIILSLLHATIPNHWLPVIAIGRKENWTLSEVTKVTFVSAIAHGLSTVIIGFFLAFLGAQMADKIEYFSHLAAPTLLILLGVFFIYRHHNHKHFHLDDNVKKKKSKKKIVAALVIAMFFSPCMEIEAYFLLAGTVAWWLIWFIASLYLIITTVGMVLLVRFAYIGVLHLNWHKLEHNAGIITGITLVATGILAYFVH